MRFDRSDFVAAWIFSILVAIFCFYAEGFGVWTLAYGLASWCGGFAFAYVWPNIFRRKK